MDKSPEADLPASAGLQSASATDGVQKPATSVRKKYSAPRLTRLGHLRDLTQKFGTSQNSDAFCVGGAGTGLTGTRCA